MAARKKQPALKRVEFRNIAPDDSGDWETGSIVDLIENIPYLLALRVIPSWRVLNEVLATGGTDAGMSGAIEWKPVTLSDDEWQATAAALTKRSKRYTYVEPPAWVTNYEEWYVWQFELRFKVPAQEHLRLHAEDRRLERAEREAAARGDADLAAELHAQRYDLGSELSAFLGRYINP